MEGLDLELPFPLFDMNVADRAKRNAATGIEGMDHSFGGWTVLQLVLQHPKHIGGDVIQFELGMVLHPPLPLDFFDVFASQVHFEQFALLGKGLLEGADDLGHGGAAAAGESNDVSVAGDIDSGSVMRSRDQPCSVIREQFGMDRSAKDAQHMLRYRGSDR